MRASVGRSPNRERGRPIAHHGYQLIDGLAAEGQRIASIFPVFMPGCDEQVAMSDSWYSPELRIILLQKRANCMGDSTTRLEHINRAEEDPQAWLRKYKKVILTALWLQLLKRLAN